MIWSLWWVWIVAAFALAVLEVLAPAQIFLGFAIGAALTGLLLLVGIPGLASSLAVTALVFAVLSGVSWLVLRRFAGVQKNQVKIWHTDINDH